jgi:ferredoxin
MRVEIDRDVCQGNQLCIGIAADVFEIDEDGLAYVSTEEIPAALVGDVEQAALSCPTRAIRLSR